MKGEREALTGSEEIDLSWQKVYVAGPMRGQPLLNRPAFFAAEAYLQAQGAWVMHPALLPDGWEFDSYLRITTQMLMECEVVAFLPGWQQSEGARKHFTRAHAFGMTLLQLDMTVLTGTPLVMQHAPLVVQT